MPPSFFTGFQETSAIRSMSVAVISSCWEEGNPRLLVTFLIQQRLALVGLLNKASLSSLKDEHSF